MDAFAQSLAVARFDRSVDARIDLSEAWTMPWPVLESVPITPVERRFGGPTIVANDVWVIPEEWCPITRRQRGVRMVAFGEAVPTGWTAFDGAMLKRRLKRIAVLDRFQTVRAGSRRSSPTTPLSWIRKTQVLVRLTRRALELDRMPRLARSRCPEGSPIFAGMTPEAFASLLGSYRCAEVTLVPRFNALYAAGLFDDWPAPDVGGRCRRGRAPSRATSRAGDAFNDNAFTHILRAALWLSEISREAIDAYCSTRSVTATPSGDRHSGRVAMYRSICARSWSSSRLRPETLMPFRLRLRSNRHARRLYERWPVTTVAGLKSLVLLCQAANAIIVLASTGMRVGELSALPFQPMLRKRGRLYLSGRRFKDTDAPQGEPRAWPLPTLAGKALERQMRLARVVTGEDRLWITLAGDRSTTGIPRLERLVGVFGSAVCLRDGTPLAELDGKTTTHRFRFTVFRLAALSLSNASQILFDVLGHDDMEVTLGYMHRDPELLADLNQVRREVRAVRVSEAFEDVEGNGGQAAEMVRRIRDVILDGGNDTRPREERAASSEAVDAADILGRAERVRPGILCLAQPLERGACSSAWGIRDHGACTPTCAHHLELASHRALRRSKVDRLLDDLQAAEGGTRVFLIGQLIANLRAFETLFEEFATDPRMERALAAEDASVLAMLPDAVQKRFSVDANGGPRAHR